MIARLVLYLILYVAAAAVVGYGGYLVVHPLLAPSIDRWRRRRLGARNAARLQEVCFLCLERVDPEVDVYEPRGWHHVSCMNKLLHD